RGGEVHRSFSRGARDAIFHCGWLAKLAAGDRYVPDHQRPLLFAIAHPARQSVLPLPDQPGVYPLAWHGGPFLHFHPLQPAPSAALACVLLAPGRCITGWLVVPRDPGGKSHSGDMLLDTCVDPPSRDA